MNTTLPIYTEPKLLTYSSLNIMLHSIILLTFLTVFFFVIISVQEKNALQNELEYLIKTSLIKALQKISRNELVDKIKNIIPQLDSIKKLYSTDTSFTTERNLLVKFTSVFFIILLVTILLTIIFTLVAGCDKNMKGLKFIIVENVVIFMFIGIIEYIFFTRIAIRYVPSSPSLLISVIIDKLNDQLYATILILKIKKNKK